MLLNVPLLIFKSNGICEYNGSISNRYNASPFYVDHNIDWTIDQYLTIFVTMLATGQTVRCDHLMLAKINS